MADLIERDKWKYRYDGQYQREIDALELDALKRQLAEAQASLEAVRDQAVAKRCIEIAMRFSIENDTRADCIAKAIRREFGLEECAERRE